MARPLCDTPLVFFVNQWYCITVNKSTDDLIQSFWFLKTLYIHHPGWLLLEILNLCKVHFTLGVSKNIQPKSSIPIGANVEISPKGLQDAKYPLTSSVQRWFHLSFCIPFAALHSSAREGFIFYIYCVHKSKRAKKFKPAAVSCKAALSGPKPAPDSFGVFSFSPRAT